MFITKRYDMMANAPGPNQYRVDEFGLTWLGKSGAAASTYVASSGVIVPTDGDGSSAWVLSTETFRLVYENSFTGAVATGGGTPFTMGTATFNQNSFYTLADNAVTVGGTGRYLVYVEGDFANGDTTASRMTGFQIFLGASGTGVKRVARPGTSAATTVRVYHSNVITLSTPSTQAISIHPAGESTDTVTATNGMLIIQKIL